MTGDEVPGDAVTCEVAVTRGMAVTRGVAPHVLFLTASLAMFSAASLSWAASARADQSLQTLYTLHCSGCHGAGGLGVPEAGIPNLNDAGRYVRTELGREYLIEVPGLSQSRLDDATAAQLLNWVLRQFSAERLPADFKPYTAAEVTRFRADKVSDPKARRTAILAELQR